LGRLLCLVFLYYACYGTAEELILRPEHGIAFEKVGLLDNDMTIWHQTFIIPLPRLDIPVTRAAVLESTRKKNDVSEFDRIAQTLMSDYARKIKELRAVLENTQVETALLLRPYDVTRNNGYSMELSTEDYLHCFGNELINMPL
jgi:hypothetical protein